MKPLKLLRQSPTLDGADSMEASGRRRQRNDVFPNRHFDANNVSTLLLHLCHHGNAISCALEGRSATISGLDVPESRPEN